MCRRRHYLLQPAQSLGADYDQAQWNPNTILKIEEEKKQKQKTATTKKKEKWHIHSWGRFWSAFKPSTKNHCNESPEAIHNKLMLHACNLLFWQEIFFIIMLLWMHFVCRTELNESPPYTLLAHTHKYIADYGCTQRTQRTHDDEHWTWPYWRMWG